MMIAQQSHKRADIALKQLNRSASLLAHLTEVGRHYLVK